MLLTVWLCIRSRYRLPSPHRFDGFNKGRGIADNAQRARRSGVDHSLGMGEAPGSNPGESMILRASKFASGANRRRRPDLNPWKSQRRAERSDRLPSVQIPASP